MAKDIDRIIARSLTAAVESQTEVARSLIRQQELLLRESQELLRLVRAIAQHLGVEDKR